MKLVRRRYDPGSESIHRQDSITSDSNLRDVAGLPMDGMQTIRMTFGDITSSPASTGCHVERQVGYEDRFHGAVADPAAFAAVKKCEPNSNKVYPLRIT